MYGMMCVLYTTGSWLVLASYLELPVSTTHSTIGSIVGMVVAYGGAECVVWMEDTDDFPYVKGMVTIVASWVISPIFSGIVSLLLFLTVRTYILRSQRAFERSFWVYPILVMFTIAVNGKGYFVEDRVRRYRESPITHANRKCATQRSIYEVRHQ